mgnify:CR=1 FL=1
MAQKPIHPTFGEKLKWIREMRGMKPPELAAKSGLSREAVYAYERGQSNVTYANACKMAQVLGIHVSFLWDHFPAPSTHH